MKTFIPNFSFISLLKILKMNYLVVFFCLLFVSSKMHGQTHANNPVNYLGI